MIVARLPAHDADEIDQSAPGIGGCDLDAVVPAEPALEHLVARHADPYRKVVTDPQSDGFQDFQAEAHAVFERSAVTVRAQVHRRRPELFDERSRLTGNLDPVHIALTDPRRGVRIVRDRAADIVILHRRRERAVNDLAQRRRGKGGKPVGEIPALAPPAMGQLNSAMGAMRMDRRRHFPELRDDLVHRAVDLPVIERILRRDSGRPAELREPDPALCLFGLVVDVTVGDVTGQHVAGFVTGAEKPVPDRQIADRQRLEQWIIDAHRRLLGRCWARAPAQVKPSRSRIW